jgi:phage terminase large subunit-like protein
MPGQGEWRRIYDVALTEIDSAKMQHRIDDAMMAIHMRLKELGTRLEGVAQERLEMQEAFRTLDALRRQLRAKAVAEPEQL